MEISDFTFESKQIGPAVFETTLANKQGGRFGCTYQSLQPIPDNVIFDNFKSNFKNFFFIDVSGEIIPEIPLTSGETSATL